MATLNQRIGELEKLLADRTPVAPVQIIFLDARNGAEYERKKLEIADIEAAGERVIVFSCVDASK